MFKPALLFQDGMVLQRETPVPVWGLADPGSEVEVTVQGHTARTRAAADGRWRLTIGPLSTSFAEEMTLRGCGCCLCLRDVQVGEVWLAAGQCNMEFYMRYDADMEAVRPGCADEALRFFDYPKVSYPGQLEQADYLAHYGRWRKAAPDQLRWFSAVGYYFARELRRRYDVPVGILGCNWSGTPACAWMSEEAILAGGGEIYLQEYREAIAGLDPAEYERVFRQFPGSWRVDPMGEDGYDRMMWGDRAALHCPPPPDPAIPQAPMPPLGPKSEKRPAGLHQNMLCQVAPYGVRGILFYQGESDGDRHNELYKTLFPALIADFRRLWGAPLPFLFVQLAPLERWQDSDGSRYALIRAVQQQAADTVPGVGMAVISDVGMRGDIHPKKKQPVGYRLALQACHRVYGEDILCEAPTLAEIRVEPGAIRLRFDHAGDGLYLAERLPDGTPADPHRLGGVTLTLDGAPFNAATLEAVAQGDTVTLRGAAPRGAHRGSGLWRLVCSQPVQQRRFARPACLPDNRRPETREGAYVMKHPAWNPYLPLWEYVPDGEPHVFEGRVYVYGSHDRFDGDGYCLNDYVGWSAPVEDLSAWRYEGVLYGRRDDPRNADGSQKLFAPDVARGPDGRYYLYYALNQTSAISVAVCDTPAGRYRYYGTVAYPDGTPLGERPGDEFQFDPGVLAEGEGAWLYTGFCPPQVPGRTGARVVQLGADMRTVCSEPVTVVPGPMTASGTPFEGHAFFEASSIRKVGRRYYFIYSSERSHELCYATADSPEGPFAYGGTLVSNGDLGLSPTPVAFTGNNHGSVEQINGQWYVFYHRATNGSSWCRQGCLEPITILPDGRIPQVEITTSGPNGGPLPARGEYPAAIACNLFLIKAAGGDDQPLQPRITQQEPDTDADQGRDTSFLENLTDRAVAGYKYFFCRGVTRMAVKTRGQHQGGQLEVRLAPDGAPVGSIPLAPGEEWHWQEAAVPLPDGVHALYLRFAGQGVVSLAAIRFPAGNTLL